jgi:hypothetical protein
VQIKNNVVHLRISLIQLFALLQINFEEVVQIIELTKFGGARNGYPFAALFNTHQHLQFLCTGIKIQQTTVLFYLVPLLFPYQNFPLADS